MDTLVLLGKTVLLRPYVFLFLAAFLFAASRLLGWPRTWFFFINTWLTALLCELSSTRTGIPFGWYFYNGSTAGHELYLWDVPFMDSLSFPFLLFGSYCLALWFLLPTRSLRHEAPLDQPRTLLPALSFDPATRCSWPVLGFTCILFALIDVVIDPVALRGDRWFLGKIYFYPEAGVYFGVPLANFFGWLVVGAVALGIYRVIDRHLPDDRKAAPSRSTTVRVLLGCGLYYGVLLFNLSVTFWIGESLLGLVGLLLYTPITTVAVLRLFDRSVVAFPHNQPVT
ncbi:MAG: carotenoid biosynthesis protein [Nitrospiraceae bacterium]